MPALYKDLNPGFLEFPVKSVYRTRTLLVCSEIQTGKVLEKQN